LAAITSNVAKILDDPKWTAMAHATMNQRDDIAKSIELATAT
jgi:hypothetical protein